MTRPDRCPCDDCGVFTRSPRGSDPRLDPDWYAVEDAVWAEAGMGRYLCLSCLARRLGRDLVAADFADAPINQNLRWG